MPRPDYHRLDELPEAPDRHQVLVEREAADRRWVGQVGPPAIRRPGPRISRVVCPVEGPSVHLRARAAAFAAVAAVGRSPRLRAHSSAAPQRCRCRRPTRPRRRRRWNSSRKTFLSTSPRSRTPTMSLSTTRCRLRTRRTSRRSRQTPTTSPNPTCLRRHQRHPASSRVRGCRPPGRRLLSRLRTLESLGRLLSTFASPSSRDVSPGGRRPREWPDGHAGGRRPLAAGNEKDEPESPREQHATRYKAGR